MAGYFDVQWLISQAMPEFKPKVVDHSLLIVGLGGNGTHLALAAVRLGFREVVGIDRDKIEPSNLSRQVLYTKADLGQPKAQIAAQALYQHNLVSKISGYELDILAEREEFARLVSAADLVFLVLDQPSTTHFATSVCQHFRKPVISGGTDVMTGTTCSVYHMPAGGRPCLNCPMRIEPWAEAWYRYYSYRPGEQLSGRSAAVAVEDTLRLPGGHASMYPTAAIGANLMMSLALQYFMGKPDLPHRLECSPFDYELRKSWLPPNPACRTCGRS